MSQVSSSHESLPASDRRKEDMRKRPKTKRPLKTVDQSSPRAYRLWCKEHAPESARQMPIDPRAKIFPGDAQCEEPGCKNRAYWEY